MVKVRLSGPAVELDGYLIVLEGDALDILVDLLEFVLHEQIGEIFRDGP
jgi:hypothetical protein